MSKTNLKAKLRAAMVVLTTVMFVTAAYGLKETVLHSFTADGSDGFNPDAGVTVDANGSVYGTTSGGGTFGYGTVYKVNNSGIETVLHSFNADGIDGTYPFGSSVVLDTAGNLYGTTSRGGAFNFGTVFKIDPSGQEAVLYSFGGNSTDGLEPNATPVLDAAGNLYGTTSVGGAFSVGTVYKITAAGSYSILYSFKGGNDGCYPFNSGVVIGKNQILYGTTFECGTGGHGTVYELTQRGVETVLHSFNVDGLDGTNPYAGVVLDAAGNMYGTTLAGGSLNSGTVFEVTAAGTETILHVFGSNSTDGFNPYSGLALDKKTGNLYGTTQRGGKSGFGVLFRIAPSGTETILHSFVANGVDGFFPYFAGVVLGKGALYGATNEGGNPGAGTVYKIAP